MNGGERVGPETLAHSRELRRLASALYPVGQTLVGLNFHLFTMGSSEEEARVPTP